MDPITGGEPAQGNDPKGGEGAEPKDPRSRTRGPTMG